VSETMLDAPAAVRALRDRVRDREGSASLLLFRVGAERFALALTAVEEVIDLEGLRVHAVPGVTDAMSGVLELRGALLPLHPAAALLGVSGSACRTALVMRAPARRVALGVDDAEDVLVAELSAVRPSPHAGRDDLLLGVLQQGTDLIGVLDGDALVAGCRADPSLESS